MAEGVLKTLEKKLEEQLNCSVCLDSYQDPKQLSCNHIYCRSCLVRLAVRDQQGQLILTCPTCRQITPVPANGVAGLKSAFHINHLLEICESVKKIQSPPIAEKLEARMRGEKPDSLNPVKVVKYCTLHRHKEVELYCETCEKLVCLRCSLRGGKHHDHDCKELSEAFEKYKSEVAASLEPMERQLKTIRGALDWFDTRHVEISDQKDAIEASIHTTVRRLHGALEQRKSELINQLHEMTQTKLKKLAVQKDQLETIQAQLSSCLDYTKESLRIDSHREMPKMKFNIAEHVRGLSTTFQRILAECDTEADMTFSVSEDMSKACQTYGLISDKLDPSKCSVRGVGLESAVVGETARLKVRAVNLKLKPCNELIQLDCELVSEITGAKIGGMVQRSSQSDYTITLQPTVKGKHQLRINTLGQPISGSPFSVEVKSPIEKLGTPISVIRGLKGPWGAAFTPQGRLVVTEYDAHCVSVFNLRGEKLHTFGTQGRGLGEFTFPRGVAVDKEGNILVADYGNNRIQKFTADGQFLVAVSTKDFPRDIAYNTSNNKIYVVATDHIRILNCDLSFFSTFGQRGSSKGQFDHPWSVACDKSGKVFVADTYNRRVQVFTTEGDCLRMFVKLGRSEGNLKLPTGVAVDNGGVVYVCDQNNHRISAFTPEGQVITSFSRIGDSEGQGVCGFAVDDNGVVCVCDKFAGCIHFF